MDEIAFRRAIISTITAAVSFENCFRIAVSVLEQCALEHYESGEKSQTYPCLIVEWVGYSVSGFDTIFPFFNAIRERAVQ